MKILLVEDVRSSLVIYSRFLERLGAMVVAADCGYRAIELFREEAPDIVLLDVMLPDIDGFEVTRRLRELEAPGNWTPIILISAQANDEYLERGIAVGGDDYIYKPISEMALAAKMRAMQRIIQMRTSLVVLTRKLDAANQELRRLSASDGLTGMPNRRFFDETIEREWRRARRNRTEITLMMCDVDHFKAYNDTYGHQAGDDCLKQVGATLLGSLERSADIAARYGGEEFAVVLPETSGDGALFVAGKILDAIRALRISHSGSSCGQVTASIGIASATPGESRPQSLIEAADRALYQAKREGRNRICRIPHPVDHVT